MLDNFSPYYTCLQSPALFSVAVDIQRGRKFQLAIKRLHKVSTSFSQQKPTTGNSHARERFATAKGGLRIMTTICKKIGDVSVISNISF